MSKKWPPLFSYRTDLFSSIFKQSASYILIELSGSTRCFEIFLLTGFAKRLMISISLRGFNNFFSSKSFMPVSHIKILLNFKIDVRIVYVRSVAIWNSFNISMNSSTCCHLKLIVNLFTKFAYF